MAYAIIPSLMFGTSTPEEIVVYAALARWTGPEGAERSHRALAEDTGLPVGRVKDALARLRERGLVEWQTRRDEIGRPLTNVYFITVGR